MDDVEGTSAMLCHDGRERTQPARAGTDVVHACPPQPPACRPRLLAQGEDVNLVTRGQSFDQPEEERNDAVCACSIDTARDDESELHDASTSS